MLKNKSKYIYKICFSLLIITLLFSNIALAQKRKPKANTSSEKNVPAKTPEPVKTPEPIKPPEPEIIKPPETSLSIEEMEKLVAVIETAAGDITLEFYPKAAPNHVRQFIWLARSGYFEGMSISRVLPKFIIQSGNPGSWEDTNPNKKKRFEIPKLKAEYDANIKHVRGVISLARPNGDPDGGTTHFFICAQKAPSLDGQYSVFGSVIKGLEIVDQLASLPLIENTDKPVDRVEVRHIKIQEKAIEKPIENEPKQ
ncbi:MAG: peptidylprolyl isomerase [Acidobacteria bacterium]|nr:peptidylprolyl isomerase [Acidobacteriota bacterium]